MSTFQTPALAVLIIAATAASVSADPRDTCADIVRHLGYPVEEYRFEEAGLFSMERHHFGTLTCYVNVRDEFDSLYDGEAPIAEDGYFGADALAERDRLGAEFDSGIAAATQVRDAKIEAARAEYVQRRDVLTQERDAALVALRALSDPSSASSGATRPDAMEATEDELSGAAADGQGDVTERTAQEKSLEPNDAAGSDARRMYVVADRLTRRTCPSTECGVVGALMHREAVEVLEERQGWGRITKPYHASCVNGTSEYVDSGNAGCDADNGIVDGMFAEWVSVEYLDSQRPADPAETAAADEELVARSDDFRRYRREFAEAARGLIDKGRCSESDFEEMGGWMSSQPEGDGVYFTYCGGAHLDNRLYLDVRTGEIYQ